MTNTAAPISRPVLADRLVTRSWATDVALVLGGAAFTSALAQVQVPLWPVPVTGQTLAVMLVGATLGARRGALSMLTYLVLGVVGLPIFAEFTGGPLSVLKPSFGFIVGFVPAAALVGWLSQRDWDKKWLLSIVAFFLASLVPFVVGLPYLAVVLSSLGVEVTLATVLTVGVVPFIVGGVAKWLIAASVLPLAWRGLRRLER
ncbi:biotin transporter BioY [Frigoribacterium endophyticum]|jgi:biotin transport system substrate-specific component|uniref:biotin transporter BioY n=1 Tax=Frigoribacterium endophyticum TaxID=1522176 RepID=UPI0014244AC4|nr:biotin transporter BioY [Frigoribacterium endophyticum]NII50774.1 biotin transport system substrate-specific component [Frigoribacterium endophyticum]